MSHSVFPGRGKTEVVDMCETLHGIIYKVSHCDIFASFLLLTACMMYTFIHYS